MADHRPAAYWDDQRGVAVYRGSQAYSCSRALLAARNGIVGQPMPAKIRAAFDEGARLETEVLQRISVGACSGVSGTGQYKRLDPTDLAAYKDMPFVRREYMHDGQFTGVVPGGGWVIQIHLDGILQLYRSDAEYRAASGLVNGGRVVAEVKKFRDGFWREWRNRGMDAFEKYAWQLSIGMHATGLPGLFGVGQYDADAPGEIGEVDVRIFDQPPVSIGVIKAHLAKVEAKYQRGEPVDVCDVDMGFFCPFWDEYHRGEQDERKLVAAAESWVAEFEEIAARIAEGQELEKQGKTLVKTARADMAELLAREGVSGADGGAKVRGGGWQLEYRVEEVPESTVTRKAYSRTVCRAKPLDELTVSSDRFAVAS